MIAAIGEVLTDEFPEYRRIGGAPFNFAANAHRLGEGVRLITRIGKDRDGDRIRDFIRTCNLDAADVQIDPVRPTGRVRVTFARDGEPRFEILKDVAYDHIRPPALSPATRLVYFGTLAQRTAGALERIQAFLSMRPPGAVAFLDVNLRPGADSRDVLIRSLAQADIVKLNDAEWDVVKALFAAETAGGDFGRWFMERFGIRMVAITRGSAGAEIRLADGTRFAESAPDLAHVADTVGAGDAFAAVLAVGWLKGLPIDRVLAAATGLAAAVCRVAGALPADTRIYEAALKRMKGETDDI